MDLFSLFFKAGPAIKLMMQEGRRISSEDFKELTPEQYEAFRKQGNSVRGKIFALCGNNEDEASGKGKPIMFCKKKELPIFDEAWEYVEYICEQSSTQYITDADKLLRVAKTLPDVFLQGGPFEHIIEERKKKRSCS